MFSNLLKKNKENLVKKIENKNHNLSIFGSSVYTDWHLILIFGLILFVAVLFNSYKMYNNVSSIDKTNSQGNSPTEQSLLDVRDIDDALSKFDFNDKEDF